MKKLFKGYGIANSYQLPFKPGVKKLFPNCLALITPEYRQGKN